MVTLFKWRSDVLLGLGTKNVLISAQEFFDVPPVSLGIRYFK